MEFRLYRATHSPTLSKHNGGNRTDRKKPVASNLEPDAFLAGHFRIFFHGSDVLHSVLCTFFLHMQQSATAVEHNK